MGNVYTINENWKFFLGDEPDADYMGFDDSSWRDVTIPHDWAVEHPFDKSNASGTGYLPGGTAWYRKHFVLPDDIVGKRVRVTFGGVYKHARVYINSNHLGMWAYGYSTFTFDISEFVKPGENVLSVRVEHEQVADSRWYTGSGIYRDVTVEITDMNCFEKDGIFITTENISEEGASLRVEYITLGCDEAEFIVTDKKGNTVSAAGCEKPEGSAELFIPRAKLWSPDTPYMYTIECHSFTDGRITDVVRIPFGVRTILFDADKGFFLNGKNMKLKGVCVHHDAGSLGAAVPSAVWRRRLEKFKKSGCNAVRTAHNPPSTDLLDLCDEMGFLVMDEAFDEWEGAKNKWWQGHNVYPPKRYGYAEDFPQWYKADLEAMIKRDRNHPCIIMWSIGNEIDYPNDPYVTPLFKEVLGNNDNGKPKEERLYDSRRPDAGRLVTVAKKLVDIAHGVDASRPVLSAMSFPELSTRTGFADVLDISGYNYRENLYEEDHKRFPDRVIFGSENGHSAPCWYAVRDNDYICGQFLWTGIDFLGECAGWPVRISQAGMLDLCGNEKPLFYMRKALWSDKPFVKIAVSVGEGENTNVWTDSFVYSGEQGEKMQISCYTNDSAVELFINGRSLGKKFADDENHYRVSWEIPFEKGELYAQTENACDRLFSSEKAEKISIEKYVCDSDIIQLEIALLDKNGNIASADDKELHFEVSGNATLLGIENGKPDDLTSYAENFRSTYRGRMIAYLRRTGIKPDFRIYVYAADNSVEGIEENG